MYKDNHARVVTQCCQRNVSSPAPEGEFTSSVEAPAAYCSTEVCFPSHNSVLRFGEFVFVCGSNKLTDLTQREDLAVSLVLNHKKI